MPKMIGLINDGKSIITRQFLEEEVSAKFVPQTRTINGIALTEDITITAEVESITNEEIDEICDQILGENLTPTQIDNLYNKLINPTLTVEGVEF